MWQKNKTLYFPFSCLNSKDKIFSTMTHSPNNSLATETKTVSLSNLHKEYGETNNNKKYDKDDFTILGIYSRDFYSYLQWTPVKEFVRLFFMKAISNNKTFGPFRNFRCKINVSYIPGSYGNNMLFCKLPPWSVDRCNLVCEIIYQVHSKGGHTIQYQIKS